MLSVSYIYHTGAESSLCLLMKVVKSVLSSEIVILMHSCVYFSTDVRAETDHLALMSCIPVSWCTSKPWEHIYKKINDCSGHQSLDLCSLTVGTIFVLQEAKKWKPKNNRWLIKTKGVVNHWLSFRNPPCFSNRQLSRDENQRIQKTSRLN